MAVTTPNYEIDPNDPALQKVESWEKRATRDSNAMYDKAHSDAQNNYENSSDFIAQWEKTQKENQQKQTDFAIEKLEQQRDQAEKDFKKEASAAYVDYQKQINPYGVEAEQRAAMGMTNTGYSESSLVSMYNQYQVRYTAAREMFQKAVLDFNNLMKEAQLANDAALGAIALEALKQQMELDVNWMAQSLSIKQAKADAQMRIESMADDKWKAVYDSLFKENTLKEEVRQFNEQAQIEKDQLQFEKDKFAYQQQQDALARSSASTNLKLRTTGKGSSKKSKYSPKSTKSAIKAVKSGSGSVNKGSNSSSSNSSSNSSATIDMDSVLALGLGPISASKLNSLVSSGVVREYVSGGKIKFAYTASGLKQKQLYSRLG